MMGKSHDEYMIEVFRDEPEYAAFMVNSILEKNDDQGELKYILQYIAAAGLRVSLAPAAAKAKAKTAAKRTKAAPAAKRVTAKPAKHAPAAKRAKAAAKAQSAAPGRSRSRTPMAAAGA